MGYRDMEACDLTKKKCKPCEGGVPALAPDEARKLHRDLKEWLLHPAKLEKSFEFRDFAEALAFINRVGEVAESEGHHPDIHLFSYRRVRIELWTHAVGGLTENDFIVAAKIDQLPR